MGQKNLLTFLFILTGFLSLAQVTDKDVLNAHVTYLASEQLEGRGLGTNGKDLAKAYIKKEFEAAGLLAMGEDHFQEFPLKIGMAWVKATNVVGLIEGADPLLKNEYIVVGAHYDHLGYEMKKDTKVIYPGADDNASGVAAIIELAKHLNKSANKPKRSLIFIAFDAEESGLLGSKHYVDTIDKTLRNQIKVMFSFDMVGMLGANKGLDLKGIGGLVNGEEIAKKHADGITLLNTSAAVENRTDTEPFGQKGIPAVHVFTGTKSPYHKPEDKADLLDYDGMAKVVDYTAKLIADVANQPQLEAVPALRNIQLSSHIGKTIMKRFNVGLVLSLGNGKHLYKDEFYDAKTAFSYNAGVQLNYKLTRVVHLNLEALYDDNRSKSAQGTFKRQSVTLPFNLEVGTPTYSGDAVRLFAFAGPYYRHNFDGKDGKTALDYEEVFEKNEWGYTVGMGLDVYNIRLAFAYRGAFQSILQDGADIRATGSYVTLGYRF